MTQLGGEVAAEAQQQQRLVLATLAAGPGSHLVPNDVYITQEYNGESFVMAPSVVWQSGTALQSLSVAAVEWCAKACRDDPSCAWFDYCDAYDGCATFQPGLAFQECRMFEANCTVVPRVAAAGAFIKRTAGFPVRVDAPQIDGYTAQVAQGVGGGGLSCPETVLPGSCAFDTPQEAASKCSSLPACQAVVVYFNGADGCSDPVSVLTSGTLLGTEALVAPSVATLTKSSPSGGGGGGDGSGGGSLSSAAIAGIAIGAAAAVAALLLGSWLLHQRRQRRLQLGSSSMSISSKAAEESSCKAAADLGSPGASGTIGAAGSGAVQLSNGSSGRQPPSGGSGGQPPSGGSGSGGLAALPELEQHVQQVEQAEACGSMSGTPGDARPLREHRLLQIESLPASLRELLVDLDEIEFLRWPSGGLQELGSGASAHVYKVLYRGEVVAAKEIDIGRSPTVQEAFVTEALHLHKLRHANVIALYGVCLSGSRGVLLMEYCGGRDLHSCLGVQAAGTQERLFSWHRRGRRVLYEVCKALNFLHAKGVVHMDVKSSNVLLTGSGTAKLADVGLARLQRGTFLSDVEPLVGTFAWMAPEVLLGGRQCSSAVDIYSLGIVIWEIVTGETPKRGRLREPQVPEECPQAVADLIDQCLRTEPSERPTAQQIMQQLGRIDGRSSTQGGD